MNKEQRRTNRWFYIARGVMITVLALTLIPAIITIFGFFLWLQVHTWYMYLRRFHREWREEAQEGTVGEAIDMGLTRAPVINTGYATAHPGDQGYRQRYTT